MTNQSNQINALEQELINISEKNSIERENLVVKEKINSIIKEFGIPFEVKQKSLEEILSEEISEENSQTIGFYIKKYKELSKIESEIIEGIENRKIPDVKKLLEYIDDDDFSNSQIVAIIDSMESFYILEEEIINEINSLNFDINKRKIERFFNEFEYTINEKIIIIYKSIIIELINLSKDIKNKFKNYKSSLANKQFEKAIEIIDSILALDIDYKYSKIRDFFLLEKNKIKDYLNSKEKKSNSINEALEILGLNKHKISNIDLKTLKQAKRKLISENHPDKNNNSELSTKNTKKIIDAYEKIENLIKKDTK